MMRKMLLAAALSVTAMTAHADYQCSVTPRDDVIVSPQTVQVKGENGNLVIRRRIIRLNYVARCRGLMKARKAASRKPVLLWIKLSFRRWAKAAKCAAV